MGHRFPYPPNQRFGAKAWFCWEAEERGLLLRPTLLGLDDAVLEAPRPLGPWTLGRAWASDMRAAE